MKKNEHLKELLNSKGIIVNTPKNIERSIIHDNDYSLIHIDNLVEIQKAFLECSEPFTLGLASDIWSDIEELKVWNRRTRIILNESGVLEIEKIVNKAEQCINKLYDLDYISLINRAMERNEICLGKPFENNLFRDSKLNVIDISKVNFNLVEHDCYKYLSRLKRRGIELQWGKLINYFVQKHELENESETYILALLSYPYDSMKFIQQYYFKGIVDKQEFLSGLNKFNK